MILRPKPEISVIRQHIDELQAQPWLDQARQWWPVYLFHCTDILNVVSILRDGEIASRSRITGAGQLALDIASPQVIASTDPQWRNCVRLYFRPRTPTQFRNEGFRPIGQWQWNSHCPVPVYLMFDAFSVLSRSDSRFSDGNLASPYTKVYRDVSFLEQVPFELVYHDSRFGPAERDQIVPRRHAEVLVPERMELDCVRFIVCRSDAEYKTLLHLLPTDTLSQWGSKIGVMAGLQLFHQEWTFVETVDMSTDRIAFRFNRSSCTPGPFDVQVEIVETATGRKYHWRNESYQCNQELTLTLSNIRDSSDYTASLYLDDHLAYASRYQDDDLPF